MKVTLLISIALTIVSVSQASLENVRCTVNELGIRWPNYDSEHSYFMCDGVNGKKIMMTCDDGDLFSFVMQSCVGPNQYVPAPPVDKLPIDSHAVVKPESVAEVAETGETKPLTNESSIKEAPVKEAPVKEAPVKEAPVMPGKKSPAAPVAKPPAPVAKPPTPVAKPPTPLGAAKKKAPQIPKALKH